MSDTDRLTIPKFIAKFEINLSRTTVATFIKDNEKTFVNDKIIEVVKKIKRSQVLILDGEKLKTAITA